MGAGYYNHTLVVNQAVEVAVSVDGTNALPATPGGGSTTICANSAYAMTLLAINQGTGPMTFVYNLRENNISGTILQGNVSSGPIAAGGTIYSAAAGALTAGTYFIETLSITDANGCQVQPVVMGAGYYNHTLTVTPQPVQPTLACYESATFNTTSCVWVVTGTQPVQPALACYESAVFNTASCVWDVSGTQPSAPSNLLSWQTATFNNVSCQWDITGTPSSSVLNLTMFIEGYYVGANTMTPVLANQFIGESATNVDTILVELRDPTAYSLVASTQALLQTDGTAICTFSTAPSGSFYVAVKHRNAVQTWSANPVAIGASSSYDFTTAANKAFGDNMKEVEPGVWAFYTGDINQDGYVDGSDIPILFNSNENFEEGYLATDLNGDGYADGTDYPILFNNSDNFIESYYPY